MRKQAERKRAWLEKPGAVERVAVLAGCRPEQVQEAHVERSADGIDCVLTVVVARRISPRDAMVVTGVLHS